MANFPLTRICGYMKVYIYSTFYQVPNNFFRKLCFMFRSFIQCPKSKVQFGLFLWSRNKAGDTLTQGKVNVNMKLLLTQLPNRKANACNCRLSGSSPVFGHLHSTPLLLQAALHIMKSPIVCLAKYSGPPCMLQERKTGNIGWAQYYT